MPRHGKKYRMAMEKVDRDARYTLDEAIPLAKEVSYANFTASIDVALNLGVDPRHADQMVRGAVVLPNGTGKEVKVLVFAEGEKAKEAREAGADFVGSKDLVEEIKDGWLDFDQTVATPDMMRYVGPIGRILGPRGLMPNPKVGTVTMDIERTVKSLKAGRVEFRVEKAGIIHAPIGQETFSDEDLKENFKALLRTLLNQRPASAKGRFVRAITISPTMGPGIKLDVSSAVSAAEL